MTLQSTLSPKVSFILSWATLLWLFAPLTASAYLDPGSGSFVVQMVVASFLGIAFTVKTFWHAIKFKISQLFSSSASRKKSNEQDPSKN